jgi:hypothetical protein
VPPKKKIPIAVNAKVEKLLGAYWKPLLRAGRHCLRQRLVRMDRREGQQATVAYPSEGPRATVFLTLANFGTFVENREEAGFVLVTADSLGGMVDVHDRRPVAASEEDARRWLDPELRRRRLNT